MKNWLPLVPGPALAILEKKRLVVLENAGTCEYGAE